jgi:methylenetetrahydrofolate dehydrogenase (NADP+)/methenyltetrahydrofolate cyclohydrolase
MAELLKGAPVAAALNEKLASKVSELKDQGVFPTLAIVRVGERPDDVAYEAGAVKRCEKIGIQAKRIALPKDAPEEELLRTLENLNYDLNVHGVLMFRPLPKHIDESLVCNALALEKDVDGITNISSAGVFAGIPIGYPPCTPQACIELLDFYNIAIESKKVAVIGRSLVVGKPLAMMLVKRNATVTICHTKTADMASVCREADILITAAGRRGLVGKDFFHPNQVVIDVSINVDDNGKLTGDTNFLEAADIVKAITPVPGGVGTVTTSVLAKHVVEAAEKSANKIK